MGRLSDVYTTTAAAQGEKRLSGGRIQAIFASDSRPLGECRIKITDRSQKFINELGFRTKKGADLNFLRQDKDPGPEVALVCQEKMLAIMRECVEDHGMSEETAIFIRFSVVGMICKAHELIEQRDLPSIEFYAD